jgi:tRNA(Ile)-lysidine synthase
VRHAEAVAAAHTADDQVETFLMHMVRGAGLNGLTGMSQRTVLPRFDPAIPLVRPLLGIWREATVAYCETHALNPRHDPSNDSLQYFRNRVRHQLIPELEIYNPRIRDVLWRTAESLSSDQAVIAERVKAEWRQAILRQTPDYVAFDAGRLAKVPVAIQRHLLRLALDHLVPGEATSHSLLDRAGVFFSDQPRRRHDLARGVVLIREPGVLYVSRGESPLPSDAWPQMPPDENTIAVAVPGQVALRGGWQLKAEARDLRTPIEDHSSRVTNLFEVELDAESLREPLVLRARRRGDRFEPLGLSGHSQKLSDFFVNEKLPVRARGRWPLLCDGELIAWIPGFRPAERCRLRRQTRRAIRLEISRAA